MIVNDSDCAASAVRFAKPMSFVNSAHPFVVPVGAILRPFDRKTSPCLKYAMSYDFEGGP